MGKPTDDPDHWIHHLPPDLRQCAHDNPTLYSALTCAAHGNRNYKEALEGAIWVLCELTKRQQEIMLSAERNSRSPHARPDGVQPDGP